MSTQRRRAATAAKFSAVREPAETTPEPARPAVRTKMIRRSVDLAPVDHYGLDAWCSRTSADLGRRVTGVSVIRALIKLMLEDEALAARVRAHPDLSD